MRKRGKKGTVSGRLLIIFASIVFAVMIGLFLIQFKNKLTDELKIEKDYLAKDLSLTMDTMQGAPGNLKYIYSSDEIDFENFTFGFRDSKATVTEAPSLQRSKVPIYKRYGENKNLRITGAEEDLTSPDVIKFSKNGKELKILKEKEESQIKLHCPAPTIPLEKTFIKVLVEAGHGGDDTGYNEKFSEANEMLHIAKFVKEGPFHDNSLKESNFEMIREKDEEIVLSERMKKVEESDAKMLISLYGGKRDDDKNVVKAYINHDSPNKENSYYLACLVLNKIIDNVVEIDGAVVIPIKMDQLSKDDTRNVLSTDKIAVYFEIGNFDREKRDNPLLKNVYNNFVQPLYDSIEEFSI